MLLRDSIRALHGLSVDEIDRILVELVANAIWHEPDSGGDHLWRLLSTLEAGILVTRHQLLLDNPPDTASVLSPRSLDSAHGYAGRSGGPQCLTGSREDAPETFDLVGDTGAAQAAPELRLVAGDDRLAGSILDLRHRLQ